MGNPRLACSRVACLRPTGAGTDTHTDAGSCADTDAGSCADTDAGTDAAGARDAGGAHRTR
jgi:hypothetical protein